jgi:protein-S-isoprenylcysteine O-methyltransferase Ste14
MARLLAKTMLFTLCVPGTLIVLVPWLIARSGRELVPLQIGSWSSAGWTFVVFGGALYLRCALDFAFQGRGTPFPLDPPKVFVSRGPYRFTRNPMYWSMGSVLLGQALLRASGSALAYLAAVVLLWILFVRLHEEPALERQFGASYARYCAHVPRWRWRLSAWAG